ncbi:hypothetical protein [Methylobacterium brachythecii]|uniref:Uncharacterized protein n=1 Tax=Methylobacterium brachythecii TaxID=1176177 RepID=A0A7W6AIU6_9HYPH|nr:hypothetical protein [Methylobacterium brachythecii]MBB3903508.1 hypothetical protein [Methylobacterium brachythecii]GLS44139.1 hypothetical protein GCM10007884_21260 [Methylobacterium brachythecii]
MSLDSPELPRPRGLLATTAIFALVLGVGGFGIAHRLAQSIEHQKSRVAALKPGIVDPETTGSIGTSARSIVIDPCVARERLIVRGP